MSTVRPTLKSIRTWAAHHARNAENVSCIALPSYLELLEPTLIEIRSFILCNAGRVDWKFTGSTPITFPQSKSAAGEIFLTNSWFVRLGRNFKLFNLFFVYLRNQHDGVSNTKHKSLLMWQIRLAAEQKLVIEGDFPTISHPYF